MPDAPPELLEQPKKLVTIQSIYGDTQDHREIAEVIVLNYESAILNAKQVDAWIKWYNAQKEIVERQSKK